MRLGYQKYRGSRPETSHGGPLIPSRWSAAFAIGFQSAAVWYPPLMAGMIAISAPSGMGV